MKTVNIDVLAAWAAPVDRSQTESRRRFGAKLARKGWQGYVVAAYPVRGVVEFFAKVEDGKVHRLERRRRWS